MENQISCTKTYRYYTLGDITKAKYILFVFHGYGQLAEFFIRKFQAVSKDFYVVAPEGMHRFYLNGSSGRVGASWMTKEAREIDIHDNLNWLNKLLKTIQTSAKFEKTIVLGFSQGGATAARWVNQLNNIDQFILWASVFPPDLNQKNEVSNTDKQENHFVLGNEDEYFDKIQQNDIISFYQSINFKTHIFKGKHNIDTATLNNILR